MSQNRKGGGENDLMKDKPFFHPHQWVFMQGQAYRGFHDHNSFF
jgi:hypothetical protein